jgi:hypothetical protein
MSVRGSVKTIAPDALTAGFAPFAHPLAVELPCSQNQAMQVRSTDSTNGVPHHPEEYVSSGARRVGVLRLTAPALPLPDYQPGL